MNPDGNGDGVLGTGVLMRASKDEIDVLVDGTVALWPLPRTPAQRLWP
jgi:hypothetical protein